MIAAKLLDCNRDDSFNRKKTVLQDMVGMERDESAMAKSVISPVEYGYKQ